MIPMILIVWTVDVFYHFVQCPLHPEWSAPCSVNWLLAAVYGIFLLLTIIFAIISSRALRKVKKQIENEFLDATEHREEIEQKSKLKDETVIKELKAEKKSKPKKIIAKKDKKSEKKK